MYSDKESHLTCSVLLHYLVKDEDMKMLLFTYTAYTIDGCRIPVL